MENKEMVLNIPVSYLNEVIDLSGRSLCGKLLKRFEIIEDRNTLKAEMKELLYEEMRKIKEILIAYNQGRELIYFDLKTKPNGSK